MHYVGQEFKKATASPHKGEFVACVEHVGAEVVGEVLKGEISLEADHGRSIGGSGRREKLVHKATRNNLAATTTHRPYHRQSCRNAKGAQTSARKKKLIPYLSKEKEARQKDLESIYVGQEFKKLLHHRAKVKLVACVEHVGAEAVAELQKGEAFLEAEKSSCPIQHLKALLHKKKKRHGNPTTRKRCYMLAKEFKKLLHHRTKVDS
ncbi:hypothetical protein DFS34DRAFT_93116 [Phlyctochytrium arcticum]|nr:hypothetical protein DFS34DRAFT_93116 [Phlyctochytrium arcticum]